MTDMDGNGTTIYEKILFLCSCTNARLAQNLMITLDIITPYQMFSFNFSLSFNWDASDSMTDQELARFIKELARFNDDFESFGLADHNLGWIPL